MREYIINGKYMAERMQGIVRYSRELVFELDNIVNDDISITLVIPPNAKEIPALKKIKIKQIGFRTGILWEQLDLGRYVRNHKKATLINLCNVTPFFVKPGITAVHDIMYRVNRNHYTTLRNRISRMWHELQYKYIFKHERIIITVSNFSKSEIEKYYPIAKGKIQVVPNGWEHVLNYDISLDWRKRYPFLKPHNYFFSLSTLSRNKNGLWIIKIAKNNPNELFVMGGKIYEAEYNDIPSNVRLLGFISDNDAAALMQNCKAFIFPSIYEGFGIPPLEALALGAEVISSNATSLPEVLGNSVHYIDPYDYNVNLDEIMKTDVDRKEALNNYSWKKSAKKLLSLL